MYYPQDRGCLAAAAAKSDDVNDLSGCGGDSVVIVRVSTGRPFSLSVCETYDPTNRSAQAPRVVEASSLSDWIPKSHLSDQPAESEFVLHFVGVSDCWGLFPAAALTSRPRATLLYTVCYGNNIFL